MAMKGRPGLTDVVDDADVGWFRADAVRASRRKRSRNC